MRQTELAVSIPKSKLVAFLLWFFLGQLGAHRFYAGKTGSAVVQLLLGLIGWFTTAIFIGWFLLVPLWIWLIVDIFLIPAMSNGKTVVRAVINEQTGAEHSGHN